MADDLAIFSLTKNELQQKLDSLEKYCRQYDLRLNLKKTKVITLNKESIKYKFYYRGKEIEIASRYTYLGFTFVPSGKKYVGIENVLQRQENMVFNTKNVK